MGLIKAAAGAGGGVLADQWKEYFYCDAINADVLAVKGRTGSGHAPCQDRRYAAQAGRGFDRPHGRKRCRDAGRARAQGRV